VTGGAGHRALDRAFEELFGVPRAFADVEIHGRTDPLILSDAWMRHHPTRPAPDPEAFRARYFQCLAEELLVDGPGKRILPGVLELLRALHGRDDTLLALLTGNYRRSACLKLEHFDLWRFFPCGAFGDDAEHRNGLVPVALARARAELDADVSAARTVIIGDTPHDVACARAGGVRALAVATGGSPVDALEEAGADVVFEALSGTGEVLAAIDALTE
jgi:phosphoglycolate phosphatase-like HAD superfamily hydrolase